MEERRNFALLQEQLEEYLGLILRESQDFHALQQDLEECNARKKSKKSRNPKRLLVADTQLNKRLCPSVRQLAGRLVGP